MLGRRRREGSRSSSMPRLRGSVDSLDQVREIQEEEQTGIGGHEWSY
jgi:hypothetical protein